MARECFEEDGLLALVGQQQLDLPERRARPPAQSDQEGERAGGRREPGRLGIEADEGSVGRRLTGESCETVAVDEYVQTDLRYLEMLLPQAGKVTVVALVGVQSHQLHRALDLAALARQRGVAHCIVGGPHPMTCDTTALQGCGVSFAQCQAELVWERVLRDALAGDLQPVYGRERRWQLEPERLHDARRMLELIEQQWDVALMKLKRAVEDGG